MSDEQVETEAPKAEEVAAEEPKRRARKVVAEEAPAESVAAEAPTPVVEKPKAAPAPDYPTMAVSAGSEHDAIRAAQKKMGVAETGVVDADTKAAVKAVQKKSGMKADGNLSAAVWTKIFA